MFDDADASRRAVCHAAGIAPEVIAIGFGGLTHSLGGDAGPAGAGFEAASGIACPMVMIEACDQSWNQSVERVIALLRRRERPDRITLILPESLATLFSDSEVEVELAPV